MTAAEGPTVPIPDEATEAAVEALDDRVLRRLGRPDIRAALAAAAPHIAAQALRDAGRTALDAGRDEVASWLMGYEARADTLDQENQ